MNGTTSCEYFVDLAFFSVPTGGKARAVFDYSDNTVYLYDGSSFVGTVPVNTPLIPARSTCVTTDSALGSINFGLAIIVTLFFVFVIAFFYNQLNNKKPWM